MSTSARSANATTTSIREKPASRLVANRNPPGEPVDVHEILALAGRHRDPAARRAAIGVEANRRLALAHHVGLRRVDLEVDVGGKSVDIPAAAEHVIAG